MRAANTRVEAGRATLRAVEGDIFTEAVAAYMDVMRDRAIVELNKNQVQVLGTNLQATRDRFEIGDLTRTDVAQSEARLEIARSSLATAGARLSASEENYRRVIGRQPDSLAPPPPLPPLPGSPEEAVRIALANNPDLLAINRAAVAAGFDVRAARGTRLPTVSGVVAGDYVNTITSNRFTDAFGQPQDPPNSGTATSIGLSGESRCTRAVFLRRGSVRRRPPKPRRLSRLSAPSAPSLPIRAPLMRPTRPRATRFSPTKSPSKPTSSHSKAPAPSRASAHAPSSTS